MGGGVGAFQWFQDRDEVLAFVTELSAAGFATFDDEDEWLKLRNELRRIAAGYEADPNAAVQAFNRELVSLLQIDWIGRLEDLMGGDGAFPAMVRARFRGDWDDLPSLISLERIKEEEKEAFVAFLADYGF